MLLLFCMRSVLRLLLRRYSPLCALASLMISLHTFLSRPFFYHAFTSKILKSFNNQSSHLNLSLSLFLLPSGWEKFIFLQGTLSSILAICSNHFSLAIVIIFTVLRSFYKPYSSFIILYFPYPIDRTCAIISLNLSCKYAPFCFIIFVDIPAVISVQHRWSNQCFVYFTCCILLQQV